MTDSVFTNDNIDEVSNDDLDNMHAEDIESRRWDYAILKGEFLRIQHVINTHVLAGNYDLDYWHHRAATVAILMRMWDEREEGIQHELRGGRR